jgi:hypothetical protein
VHPGPVQVATEGALWGTIAAKGHFGGTMVVSDGAGDALASPVLSLK